MLHVVSYVYIYFFLQLDVDSFIELQEAIQPDWFECLSDSDTNKESSRKRATKAVDRTLGFLDNIINKHKHSKVQFHNLPWFT